MPTKVRQQARPLSTIVQQLLHNLSERRLVALYDFIVVFARYRSPRLKNSCPPLTVSLLPRHRLHYPQPLSRLAVPPSLHGERGRSDAWGEWESGKVGTHVVQWT